MQRFYSENDKLTLKSNLEEFSSIRSVEDLFNAFLGVWTIDTCSPKFRENFSKDNPTAGQCSITAILIQSLFGGEIYRAKTSVALHCYNVINDTVFDITAEQFGEEKIDYSNKYPFDKTEFFSNQQNFERYLLLKKYLYEKFNVTRF